MSGSLKHFLIQFQMWRFVCWIIIMCPWLQLNFQFCFCVWLHCSTHSTLTTYLTTDCSRHHHVTEQQQMWRYRQGQKRSVLNLHEVAHASTKNNSSHFHLPDWSCPFVRQQWMTSWETADIVGKCPCQTMLCQESLESISRYKQNNSYFK